ncbi:MAG: sulfotransferase [Paracoccaceae bacterium]
MTSQAEIRMPFEKSVFVVTYGRSGSTLLQNLLNTIDGYCIRGENDNLIIPLAYSWLRASTSQEIRTRSAVNTPTLPHDPWYGVEQMDVEAYGAELIQGFVSHILKPPARTRVIGFKEVRWGEQGDRLHMPLDFMKRFFPNARFIINTRNLDQVARSGWWAQQDHRDVVDHLSKVEKTMLAWHDKNRDCAVHLHYDDYMADKTLFRSLFDFLDEPWDEPRVTSVLAQRLDHMLPTAPSASDPSSREHP